MSSESFVTNILININTGPTEQCIQHSFLIMKYSTRSRTPKEAQGFDRSLRLKHTLDICQDRASPTSRRDSARSIPSINDLAIIGKIRNRDVIKPLFHRTSKDETVMWLDSKLY